MQTRVGAVPAMRLARLTPPAAGGSAALAVLSLYSCLITAAVAQDQAAAPPDGDPAPATLAPAEAESEFGPPLISAAERTEWLRSRQPKYRNALALDQPSAADKDELTLAVKTALYSLTLYENDGDPLGFLNVVRTLGDDLRKLNTKKQPRDHMNAEIVRVASDLLDKAPKSRLNAVIIVASLSSDPATSPPKPYVPGFKFLLTVLNEPTQFVDCKIWAANGLGRICRDGDPGINDRNAIVADLITALDGPQARLPANWWFRMRLLDALGDSNLVYNLIQKPVAIDTLMKVLTDRQEDWIIRSTAARAVTQLPWTATTNVPLITSEIARLTDEMAQARNQQLNNPRWKWCFVNIYMSFMPDTAEEIQKRWGLRQQVERPGLGGHKLLVDAAYQVVLPVVNSVTGSANPVPTPPASLQNLENWLQNNVPQDLKVTPESEELKQTEPVPKPITGGGGHSASWSAQRTVRAVRQSGRVCPIMTPTSVG